MPECFYYNIILRNDEYKYKYAAKTLLSSQKAALIVLRLMHYAENFSLVKVDAFFKKPYQVQLSDPNPNPWVTDFFHLI